MGHKRKPHASLEDTKQSASNLATLEHIEDGGQESAAGAPSSSGSSSSSSGTNTAPADADDSKHRLGNKLLLNVTAPPRALGRQLSRGVGHIRRRQQHFRNDVLCLRVMNEVLPQQLVDDVRSQLQAGAAPLVAVEHVAKHRLGRLASADVSKLFLVLAASSSACCGLVHLARGALCLVARPLRLRKPVQCFTSVLMPTGLYGTLLGAYLGVLTVQGALRELSRAAEDDTSDGEPAVATAGAGSGNSGQQVAAAAGSRRGGSRSSSRTRKAPRAQGQGSGSADKNEQQQQQRGRPWWAVWRRNSNTKQQQQPQVAEQGGVLAPAAPAAAADAGGAAAAAGAAPLQLSAEPAAPLPAAAAGTAAPADGGNGAASLATQSLSQPARDATADEGPETPDRKQPQQHDEEEDEPLEVPRTPAAAAAAAATGTASSSPSAQPDHHSSNRLPGLRHHHPLRPVGSGSSSSSSAAAPAGEASLDAEGLAEHLHQHRLKLRHLDPREPTGTAAAVNGGGRVHNCDGEAAAAPLPQLWLSPSPRGDGPPASRSNGRGSNSGNPFGEVILRSVSSDQGAAVAGAAAAALEPPQLSEFEQQASKLQRRWSTDVQGDDDDGSTTPNSLVRRLSSKLFSGGPFGPPVFNRLPSGKPVCKITAAAAAAEELERQRRLRTQTSIDLHRLSLPVTQPGQGLQRSSSTAAAAAAAGADSGSDGALAAPAVAGSMQATEGAGPADDLPVAPKKQRSLDWGHA